MIKFTWFKSQVPNNLKVKQVYGIAFDNNGNIFLRIDDNKYKLTGGKPEEFDKGFVETLKRECLEEVNILLGDIHYLGYLLVEENNEKYAQVRMIAKIEEIGEIKSDSDSGKIYKRFMCSKENVKKKLNYSDKAGNDMLDDAIKLAKDIYNIEFTNKEYFIDN